MRLNCEHPIAAVAAATVLVDAAAAVRACGKELKSNVRGCWLRLSLCLLLFSLVFIGTVLPVSANYTVDAIGMIAVMTGWLSKAFRAVFPLWSFCYGTQSGYLRLRVYVFVYMPSPACMHMCISLFVITLVWLPLAFFSQ